MSILITNFVGLLLFVLLCITATTAIFVALSAIWFMNKYQFLQKPVFTMLILIVSITLCYEIVNSYNKSVQNAIQQNVNTIKPPEQKITDKKITPQEQRKIDQQIKDTQKIETLMRTANIRGKTRCSGKQNPV